MKTTKVDWTQYNDFKLLQACILGEAGGEPLEGQIAVGLVVRNRVREGRYGVGYRGVLLRPFQFSCFNEDSPACIRMTDFIHFNRPASLYDQIWWVAKGIMAEFITDDITHGANHYLTVSLFESEDRPGWADPQKVTRRVGNHVFLKL